jgi:hypothetical protein
MGVDLAEQLLVAGETVLLLDASLAPPSESGDDRRISMARALEDDEDFSRLAEEDLVVIRVDVALSCLDPSVLSSLAEPDLAIACLSVEAPLNAERILALSDVVVIVLPPDVDRVRACVLADIVAGAAPGACLALLGGSSVARGRVRAVAESRTERHLRDLGEGGSLSVERLLRLLEAAEAWALPGEQDPLLVRMCRALVRTCGGDS